MPSTSIVHTPGDRFAQLSGFVAHYAYADATPRVIGHYRVYGVRGGNQDHSARFTLYGIDESKKGIESAFVKLHEAKGVHFQESCDIDDPQLHQFWIDLDMILANLGTLPSMPCKLDARREL